MNIDLVVIGGGAIGLGIAYYVAKKGLTPLVLEQGYLGSGCTGRSFGLIKERWIDPDVSKLACTGLKAHKKLPSELGVNTLFRQDGCLTIALTKEELEELEKIHKMHKQLGIQSKLLDSNQIRSFLIPPISDKVLAGCLDKREGLIYSPTLLWGLSEGLQDQGGELRKFCGATKIKMEKKSVVGVETTAGEYIRTKNIVVASGIGSRDLLKTVGLKLPLKSQKKEILVTEPMKPILDMVLERYSNGFRVGQTMRGEIIGTHGFTPDQCDLSRHSFHFLTTFSRDLLDLMPSFSRLKVLRQWAGILDTTQDLKPLIGGTKINGLTVACGFHEYGITLAPVVSKMLANLLVNGTLHPLLKPFNPQRFPIMN